jgi:hypothetical protein
MDVWCVCAFFYVCVVLCLARGLATSWSPVQGVLPSVNDEETEKSALCSKVGAMRKEKKIIDMLLIFFTLLLFLCDSTNQYGSRSPIFRDAESCLQIFRRTYCTYTGQYKHKGEKCWYSMSGMGF